MKRRLLRFWLLVLFWLGVGFTQVQAEETFLDEIFEDTPVLQQYLNLDRAIKRGDTEEAVKIILEMDENDSFEVENKESIQSFKKSSDNEKLIIPDITQKKFPQLVQSIINSKSMDNKERNYWLQVLPKMTKDQVDELRNILDTEKRKLDEIEKKYSSSQNKK